MPNANERSFAHFLYFCAMQLYKIIRALSLDVVAGACISSVALGSVLYEQVQIVPVVALGLSVWVIYTFDHLWDVRKKETEPVTFRHFIHWKYSRLIQVFFGAAVISLLIFLAFVPRILLWSGLLLGLGVILYFWVNIRFKKRRWLPKEVVGAFIYAAGVFLPALATDYFHVPVASWVFFAEFFLLALINLYIFSFYEFSKDKKQGYHSMVTDFGIKRSKQIIAFHFVLLLGVALLALWQLPAHMLMLHLILVIMGVQLLAIFIFPRYFEKAERYRIAGDIIFLYPAALYLFI